MRKFSSESSHSLSEIGRKVRVRMREEVLGFEEGREICKRSRNRTQLKWWWRCFSNTVLV